MGAIDNLVKGAAGQAVQNMNLLFGLPGERRPGAGSLLPLKQTRTRTKGLHTSMSKQFTIKPMTIEDYDGCMPSG